MSRTRPTRRHVLQSAAALSALGPLAALVPPAAAQERRFAPEPGAWRRFEVTTTLNVADAQGGARVWVPLPDVDTGYQRTLGHDYTSNGSARLVADPASGVRMLYAEFPAGVAAPTVTVTSRIETRNRATDWTQRGAPAEDPAVLRAYLAPSELKPLDGIVRKTALEATKGAGSSDVEKARAIYRWVVVNAHREPKTRGCGTGDVKGMLESGNLGGKCADLNAIFVALCRASGIPARDVYGVRVAPSAFGYRELGANPANLKGAQHCRAEAYLRGHGWVAMDPADVLKVMRQETSDWIKDAAHPLVAPVNRGLFGGWEGNWMAYNTAEDVRLPGSAGKGTLGFLMYPNGENASGRFDELAPDAFRYVISARELS
ncbi:transglutaminase domain-containing protein [Piscinibacter sakaiensis]|uniref:Transglutaminase-like domain-containing protein n=1 Tax=Piscinibacter sakaiensis TaxID=1547922 RepID=A0A0K8NU03_PISS1|nr:transglutaminase domain-containing protein [Piscinibacter sakaiensis]GAP33734.1 hypothetical protein ISF6_0989 [Piscinibacter sakaiensis]